jgi:deglycase
MSGSLQGKKIGVANPDQLRTNPKAVAFAPAFFESGKPVGVICHGPWTLIEADVVRAGPSPRGPA